MLTSIFFVSPVAQLVRAKENGVDWFGNNPSKDPASIAESLILHPVDTSWQDAVVTEWAGKHAQQLKRGESSEWEALENAHKQDVIDAINKTTKQSTDIWKYINDSYDAMCLCFSHVWFCIRWNGHARFSASAEVKHRKFS